MQQDENVEEDIDDHLNDSMPDTGNIITTDDDVLIIDDKEMQSNRISNMHNMQYRQQINDMAQKPAGKIYNTHDGR